LAAAKTYEPLAVAKPSRLIPDDPGLDLALTSLYVPGDILTPKPVAPDEDAFENKFANEMEIELQLGYEHPVAANCMDSKHDTPSDSTIHVDTVDIVPVVRILQLDSTCIAIYQKHKQNTLFRPKLQRILENGSDNTIHFLSSIITD
jgi:hypothetical protein